MDGAGLVLPFRRFGVSLEFRNGLFLDTASYRFENEKKRPDKKNLPKRKNCLARQDGPKFPTGF